MKPKIKAASDRVTKSKKQPTQSKKFIVTVIKILLVFFVAISCAAVGILGGAIFGYIKTAPVITDDMLNAKVLTSFIYDSQKHEIAQLKGIENKNRVWADDNEISQNLKDAFVAIEDERFYKHRGVDFSRTISATANYFFKLVGLPGKKYGGSTITQQLVKNVTGDKRDSPQRKVQEMWNALQLENKYEKWQILLMYMNEIYMGYNFYGVQTASRAYFGKDVNKLSLAECAVLAGITNSPSHYNPFNEKTHEKIKQRQKNILAKMLEHEYISQQEYDQALMEELKYAERDDSLSKATSKQSYFVDQVISDVREDLMKKYDWSKNMADTLIYSGGLQIYTTQDTEMQKAMDEVFTNDKYFPKVKNRKEHAQAAMVIIDPKTGQVKALYGGYGKKQADMVFNRASSNLMKRHAGSSFKPIAVYAPFIDSGLITAATIFDDVPVHFNEKDRSKPYPSNYDSGDYKGLTSVRNSIKDSVNVVAAQIWLKDPDKSLEYLKKAGLNRDNERYLSLALGGLNEGVSPLQMAAAYQPFVDKGRYHEPITYTKVLDKDGKTILEKKSKTNNVYQDDRTAFIMTNMMMDVVKYGTAKGYGIQGGKMPTAGKTGTSSNYIDKWFVGYTPYYVGATWYGYDNNGGTPIRVKSVEYSQALKIWNAVMEKVHKDLPVKQFEEPAGIVRKKICIYSGKVATDLCAHDPRGNATREEVFIKGTEPADEDLCDVHVHAKICKDSKDAYGRPQLAGPACPAASVVDGIFIHRLQPFKPQYSGDPYPADWKYDIASDEYCTLHGGGQPLPGLDPLTDPDATPTVTPEPTPEVDPETTPGIDPEVTPKVTPEPTPDSTPETTPVPGETTDPSVSETNQ